MEKAGIVIAALTPCLILLSIIIYQLRNQIPTTSFLEIDLCLGLVILSILFIGLWGWGINHYRSLFTHQLAYGFYEAFLLAAIPEELSRYLLLRWRLARLTHPLDLSRCMLLGCLVGLAFGTIEHVAFCLGEGWHSCWQRLLVNVPYHTFAGAIIAYFIGLTLLKRREAWGWLGLIITIVLHGTNNFNLRRFFETVPTPHQANLIVEHSTGWIEEILVTHWPSNILVTLSTSVITLILFFKALRTRGQQ